MIIDLHQDIGTSVGNPNSDTFGQVDFDQLRENDVRLALTTNYWLTPKGSPRIKDQGVVREYERRMRSGETIIKNLKDWIDFSQNMHRKGVSLILVQEGFITPEPNSWRVAKSRIEDLFDLGIRVLQPIYWGFEKHWRREEKPGPIGSSAFDRLELGEEEGLTDLGKKICKEWLKMGGIIDASHSSPQTLRDIVEICKDKNAPLLISHTGLAGIGKYPRCLREEQLKMLKLAFQNDLLIGIGTGKAFFKRSDDPDLDHFLQTIRAIAEVVGWNHIAIGSDLGGAISGLLGDYEKAEEILPDISERLRKEFGEERYEEVSFDNAYCFLENAMHFLENR